MGGLLRALPRTLTTAVRVPAGPKSARLLTKRALGLVSDWPWAVLLLTCRELWGPFSVWP